MGKMIDIRMFHECFGSHRHDYPQILVPLKKAMTIDVGGENFELTPKQLCFIPRGMAHQCAFEGELLALNISGPLVQKEVDSLLTHPVVAPMQDQIFMLVELIRMELKNNPASQSVDLLYTYLYSKLVENQQPPSIRYVDERYTGAITVEELAAIENYSVAYYNNWFKNQTGMSPGAYIRCRRIEKAKELLRETRYGVTEIALMVGYSSNSTFTRAFSAQTGMAPKRFRTSAQKIRRQNRARVLSTQPGMAI